MLHTTLHDEEEEKTKKTFWNVVTWIIIEFFAKNAFSVCKSCEASEWDKDMMKTAANWLKLLTSTNTTKKISRKIICNCSKMWRIRNLFAFRHIAKSLCSVPESVMFKSQFAGICWFLSICTIAFEWEQQQFQHSTWVQFTSKYMNLLASIACMHHIYWLFQYLNVYAYRIGDRYGSLAHTLSTHRSYTKPQSILMWMLIVTRLKIYVCIRNALPRKARTE